MATIKLGLVHLTPRALVSKAQDIEFKMAGNTHFPSPTPSLADIKAKRIELESLIVTAVYGPPETKVARDTCASEIREMLHLLAKYVSFTANGDEGIIKSSGFETRKKPRALQSLAQPMALVAKRSDTSGVVKLNWKAIRGSRIYTVEFTTTDPAKSTPTWQQIAMTTRSKSEISELIPGTYYWFRVQAIGANTRSPYSDVALIMAA